MAYGVTGERWYIAGVSTLVSLLALHDLVAPQRRREDPLLAGAVVLIVVATGAFVYAAAILTRVVDGNVITALFVLISVGVGCAWLAYFQLSVQRPALKGERRRPEEP